MRAACSARKDERVLNRNPQARVLVDKSAIAHNVRLFTSLMRGGKVMAVVKADGYGAGAQAVASAALAAGASCLGAASIDEALALRKAGFTAPILAWLNPVTADFPAALASGIELAVPSLGHLEAIASAARKTGTEARVHLQVDCGMAREGSAPKQWAALFAATARAVAAGSIDLVGLMGHLSHADSPDDPINAVEARRFAEAKELAHSFGLRPQTLHLAATAAALANPAARHDMCRVGAGLLGIDPTRSGALRPALTLQAQIVEIRQIAAGTPVGYGHTWRAPHDTLLANVAAGYADGISRHLSPDARVLVGGRRCPIVGRVSMDQVVVRLGATGAHPGDYVTFYGLGRDGEPTIDDWAAWCGTIPNEVATSLGPRVARVQTGRGGPPLSAAPFVGSALAVAA